MAEYAPFMVDALALKHVSCLREDPTISSGKNMEAFGF